MSGPLAPDMKISEACNTQYVEITFDEFLQPNKDQEEYIHPQRDPREHPGWCDICKGYCYGDCEANGLRPEPKNHYTSSYDSDYNIETHVAITSRLGIGGHGSDDYNINTEYTPYPPETPSHNNAGGNGKCRECGKPAQWNSGAGGHLCSRHWDEY